MPAAAARLPSLRQRKLALCQILSKLVSPLSCTLQTAAWMQALFPTSAGAAAGQQAVAGCREWVQLQAQVIQLLL